MKIITRYLLREYLINLVYCLAAFIMLFVLYDLFDKFGILLEARTPPLTMLKYYGGLIAMSVEYLAPASIMLATLYTLWRMTRNNEIIAMRASGISLFSIMLPFMMVGLVAVGGTWVLKDVISPRAGFWSVMLSKNKMREVKNIPIYNHAYYYPRGRRQWLIDAFDLADPKVLGGVKVTQEDDKGNRISEMRALRAENLDGEWWFFGIQVRRFDAGGNPMGKLVPRKPDINDVKAMPMLTETPKDIAMSVKKWDFLTSFEMRYYLREHPDIKDQSRAWRVYDVCARMAAPWVCLIVTILGVPAGVMGGRRNALTGVMLALGLFFVFYAVNQLGVYLGKKAIVAPCLAAWMTDIIFLAAGLVLAWRLR